ncbi:MBL fold metallo-hydrolase [Niastella yeongjuensis]|uniref:MBL fold metallo-hydrolase n=1 Tax=Niastella yeongjuensis TaxID=354355 RepID=A0A1V9E0W5_9BACT|nr:MBL fold metallo-hydrolase [Niastella yeongjuensis]OQP39750.1 MBL fold metallo-hydrolase [Niastella yeongjuensis]SEO04006.1 Glyoxylase, beta-lactamase superfamily II [Niastella yeongjuensis]
MKSGTTKSVIDVNWFTVAPGVWGLREGYVNVYLIHNAVEKKWVLVDAGLKRSAMKIKELAEYLFWPDSKPAAIILTHGHFDHVGAAKELANDWDVPVFAQLMEVPYLSGLSPYPPADPWAGGGLLSAVSSVFPTGPVNINEHLQILPDDGSLPFLPDWKFIHTPGHSPGHISLWRRRDRVLLAGDAFVTTRQESIWSVLRQSRKLTGPPRYFTYDWAAAEKSVKTLAALEPEIVATGHGMPMRGEEMRKMLHNLADNFKELAVPLRGRYTREPGVAGTEGVTYIPKPVNKITPIVAVAAGAAVLGFTAWMVYKSRKNNIES